MIQGKLFYDTGIDRYNFYYKDKRETREYGGIHCGETFECCLKEVWIPTRMEMDFGGQWYLVGLPGLRLDGRAIRMM